MSGPSLLILLPAVAIASALIGSGYVLFFALLGERTPRSQCARDEREEGRTRFLVLVPAHNEEGGIRPLLGSLKRFEYPPNLYRVIVIADNCQDKTAAVVREEGFECWVRTEPTERGKGHALRWGLDRAQGLAFDAVVFIDADSEVEPGFLGAFDQELRRGARVLQACEEFKGEAGAALPLFTIASKRAEGRLFWRPRQRLGLAIFLQGNGFSIRRDVLNEINWTAYSIVEDLEYSLKLALGGVRVHYVESARVLARLPSSASEAFPQRLRWASGTLQVILRYLPRLLGRALVRRDFYLAEAAVALVVTSRMLLVYLGLFAFGFAYLVFPVSWRPQLLATALVVFAMQFVYLLCVIDTVAEVGSRWRALAWLPLYTAWLLAVQVLAALGIGRNVWKHTGGGTR